MARYLLLLILIAALGFAIAGILRAGREVATTLNSIKGDMMPSPVRNIAFAILLVVMFGVSSGWLGAL